MNVLRCPRRIGLILGVLLAFPAMGVTIVAAQDIMTKGIIGGTVVDATGGVMANVQVTVTGEIEKRTVATDQTGRFEVPNLLPGSYAVKAELTGFKTTTMSNVVVNVGRTTSMRLVMQVGNIVEQVVVTSGAEAVDLTSTSISSNLNEKLFENLPLARAVTSLFYLAPGATDGVISANNASRANPSISGGSALDSLYIADGVNVTDSAFGGFGVFSRSYGSLGVGITTSYVQEVQVKTGAFEPQYGQAEGGIVNIITKSGTNEYHGEVWGYGQPKTWEGLRNQRDDFAVNKFGKYLHPENYDTGVDLGGPIPLTGKRLFFFGSYNPTIQRMIVQGAEGSGLMNLLGTSAERQYSKNYAAKIDANLATAHQVNLSIFGDPTTTNVAPWRIIGASSIDNLTANSSLDYGTRNMAARYTGSLSPTWTVNASYSWGHNHFNESGFADYNQIVDRTQAARGNFTAVGLGFYEPTVNNTYRTTYDTQKIVKFLGSHTFGLGYQYQRAYYSGVRDRSGPKYTVPATNADGTYNVNSKAVGKTMNAAWSLRTADSSCTLCPLLNVPGSGLVPVFLRQDRGEFGVPVFDTRSNYHSAYLQDTWRLNHYVSILAGYRWEQEQLIGSPGPSGNRNTYTFTDNWSPRFGVTIDPRGTGKTKIYYNFGRFTQYFPLDGAERSLSSELDITGGGFAPAYTIVNGRRIATLNQFGTVIPVVDAAHLLSKAAGGITTGSGSAVAVAAQDATNPILPGTKLGFAQEHMLGFEQELPHNLYLSVRYIDRRLMRIIEDAALDPPEDGAFLGAFGQTYFIGNINAKTDAGVNPIEFTYPIGGTVPAACDPSLVATATDRNNNPLGKFCFAALGKNGKPAGDPGADGIPDGFVDPVRIYRAVEIELNKRFSNNWQMLANWRIASLRGNYEGAFRNDNQQTDPSISSLFDFTPGAFNLLGDQFAVGPLNTDRRHVVNVYANYMLNKSVLKDRWGFLNGLNIGTGFHLQSGLPMSNLAAHPVYLNSGEVPLGGRGILGRNPTAIRIDLHFDYPLNITEKAKLAFVGDIFNITNTQTLFLINQLSESTFQQANPDFKQPTLWANPVSFRMGLKFSF